MTVHLCVTRRRRQLVLAAAAVSWAVVQGACGSAQTGTVVTPSIASSTARIAPSSPTATASPVPSSAASSARVVTVERCPATVTNRAGMYSFTCPSGWSYINCENYAFTWLVNPGNCSGEGFGTRMEVWSVAGDLSATFENNQGPGMYLGQRQSSERFTVSGVIGLRRIYLVTVGNPLPPPKGTLQIRYVFVTNGRTYFAPYDRYPGDTDVSNAFDRMISRSLKFSA